MKNEKWKNLKIARDHLASIADEIKKHDAFDMNHFRMEQPSCRPVYPSKALNYPAPCGTIGCALGWIATCEKFKEQSNNSYTYIGFSNWIFPFDNYSNEWDFLFSGDYKETTIEDAIGRIDVLLKYPDLFKEER